MTEFHPHSPGTPIRARRSAPASAGGPADQKLRVVLAAGGGLAGRTQLLAADLSASMITRRLRDGEPCAVVPGVHRAAGTALTPELRLHAVTLR